MAALTGPTQQVAKPDWWDSRLSRPFKQGIPTGSHNIHTYKKQVCTVCSSFTITTTFLVISKPSISRSIIVSVGYLKPFSCSQPEDYWDHSLAWTKSGWKAKWSLDETRGLWQSIDIWRAEDENELVLLVHIGDPFRGWLVSIISSVQGEAVG